MSASGAPEAAERIAELEAQLRIANETMLRYENREASCCPEDVGCDEFIAQLQTTISQLQNDVAHIEMDRDIARQQSEQFLGDRKAVTEDYTNAVATIGTLTAALQQIAFWTKNTGMQAIYSTADAALAQIPKEEAK